MKKSFKDICTKSKLSLFVKLTLCTAHVSSNKQSNAQELKINKKTIVMHTYNILEDLN